MASTTLTIKNTGNLRLFGRYELPHSQSPFFKDYPKNYPQYVFKECEKTPLGFKFMPGEVERCSLTVKDFDFSKTPVGEYEAEGMICSAFTGSLANCSEALYIKRFKIKTIVTE